VVTRDRAALSDALRQAGFSGAELTETGRFFMMGVAHR